MALLNFLRVLSVVSLAVLHASFDALPVNAVAVEPAHVGRSLGHAHAEIARKRDSSKMCRPRPSSYSASHAVGAVAAPTHTVTTTTSPPSVPPSSLSKSAETTTSSQSPSTSTPSSSGGSKILLGWSNNEQGSLKNFVTDKTYYIFNWKPDPYPPAYLGQSADIFANNLQFIATIHSGPDALNAADIPNKVPKRGPIKTFNEPELISQGNVDVKYGYQLWMEHILPLANQGYELIAPSITTGDVGRTWITTFFGLCKGQCKVSAMDLHIYTTTGDEFIETVKNFTSSFGYNVWVTETACHDYSGKGNWCSEDQVNSYYHSVMNFALGSPLIEKISFFSLFRGDELEKNNVNPLNSMMTCSGGNLDNCTPNKLGYRFINAQP